MNPLIQWEFPPYGPCPRCSKPYKEHSWVGCVYISHAPLSRGGANSFEVVDGRLRVSFDHGELTLSPEATEKFLAYSRLLANLSRLATKLSYEITHGGHGVGIPFPHTPYVRCDECRFIALSERAGEMQEYHNLHLHDGEEVAQVHLLTGPELLGHHPSHIRHRRKDKDIRKCVQMPGWKPVDCVECA